MSVQFEEVVATAPAPADGLEGNDDWDLDVSIVESGPEADRLIQMTDDGCGRTCQSACPTTCP
ncbi:FxLD family lanthipeptide [Streptomyces sp. NPDC059894]|uniref:FxLD family lanthipeptide n=1 Tax=unclassified Streptomyces TaxID=2593676 RepID=UPI003648DD45